MKLQRRVLGAAALGISAMLVVMPPVEVVESSTTSTDSSLAATQLVNVRSAEPAVERGQAVVLCPPNRETGESRYPVSVFVP